MPIDVTKEIQMLRASAENIDRRSAEMVMFLESRHPVRFFRLADIQKAVAETAATVSYCKHHHLACDCRFCATQLLKPSP